MHHLALRIVALLAALFMALPASAFERAAYWCSGMGKVMTESCCCGSPEDTRANSSSCEVKRSDCCTRLPGADREATPAVRDAATQVPPSAFVVTLAVLTPVVEDHGRVLGGATRQARAPPPLGPPLFIKNCSLLS